MIVYVSLMVTTDEKTCYTKDHDKVKAYQYKEVIITKDNRIRSQEQWNYETEKQLTKWQRSGPILPRRLTLKLKNN